MLSASVHIYKNGLIFNIRKEKYLNENAHIDARCYQHLYIHITVIKRDYISQIVKQFNRKFN